MTTYKKTALIGLSVLALQLMTSLSNVYAQESLMATLDKDLDGLISLKEAAGHATLLEKFNVIDVNEDGYISMDELIASDITKG
jgi:Ca2+-binding EF-hand superfamily protein